METVRPVIYAHRGASGYAPENTLEAFELAAKLGTDGVELDVHICKDGELVVAHDETVERVSDGTGYIKDMTLKELKQLNFNRMNTSYDCVRIPTLREVFQLLYDTDLKIDIELKNSLIDYEDLERRVADMVEKEFSPDRVVYSSFNHQSMIRMKQLNPDSNCGILYEASMVAPWTYAKGLGVDAINPHYSQIATLAKCCEESHRAGIQVNTWTVNTRHEMQQILKAGVDMMITNFPDIGQECVREIWG